MERQNKVILDLRKKNFELRSKVTDVEDKYKKEKVELKEKRKND